MLRFLLILALTGFVYAGTPAEVWLPTEDWYGVYDTARTTPGDTTWIHRPMVKAQRDFAYRCIEWGEKNYGMGHTLAAIAWMESSLGADTDHGDEDSDGEFGQGYTTSRIIKARNPRSFKTNQRMPSNDFNDKITVAALLYTDNIRYIKQWHRNRGLTITDREAWRKASQVYPGGTRWQNRAEYGRVFRKRCAFLRTLRRNNANRL